jgi:hypothetical protein
MFLWRSLCGRILLEHSAHEICIKWSHPQHRNRLFYSCLNSLKHWLSVSKTCLPLLMLLKCSCIVQGLPQIPQCCLLVKYPVPLQWTVDAHQFCFPATIASPSFQGSSPTCPPLTLSSCVRFVSGSNRSREDKNLENGFISPYSRMTQSHLTPCLFGLGVFENDTPEGGPTAVGTGVRPCVFVSQINLRASLRVNCEYENGHVPVSRADRKQLFVCPLLVLMNVVVRGLARPTMLSNLDFLQMRATAFFNVSDRGTIRSYSSDA